MSNQDEKIRPILFYGKPIKEEDLRDPDYLVRLIEAIVEAKILEHKLELWETFLNMLK